jgi:hypothetical protein
MATESIGAIYSTAIPGYEDSADIQEAFRAYHYGSYSYDPANTSTASLVNPSIAYYLNDLQSQITSVSSGGIQESVFTAKGDLLSASASSTPLILGVGSNNQILVANNATGTGLEWTSTLTSPTLASAIATTAFTLNATAELRLADTDSSHYVGFKAPGTVSTNLIWTLPSTDGSSGEVLSTDGSGTLSWSAGGGGGGGSAALSDIFMLAGM